MPASKKALEINTSHPLLKAMSEAYEKDAGSEELKRCLGLLYGQAVLMMAAGRRTRPGSRRP